MLARFIFLLLLICPSVLLSQNDPKLIVLIGRDSLDIKKQFHKNYNFFDRIDQHNLSYGLVADTTDDNTDWIAYTFVCEKRRCVWEGITLSASQYFTLVDYLNDRFTKVQNALWHDHSRNLWMHITEVEDDFVSLSISSKLDLLKD